MPLKKSGSDKALRDNISAEIKSGRPRDQALAIAFRVQRDAKSKKMCKGGSVGYAKGGMVKAKAPKAGKSLFSAAVPKMPDFGKDLGKPTKAAAPAKSSSGMPRMPKMPATGKAAMTNKMAAITKPKAPAFAKGGSVKKMPKGKC